MALNPFDLALFKSSSVPLFLDCFSIAVAPSFPFTAHK